MLVLGLLCTAVAWPILFRPPAFGVAWVALFLAEPLPPGTLVGAVLVLASVGIVLDMRLRWQPGRSLGLDARPGGGNA